MVRTVAVETCAISSQPERLCCLSPWRRRERNRAPASPTSLLEHCCSNPKDYKQFLIKQIGLIPI